MEIPPSCCHVALLLIAAISLDSADFTVTRPKHCQKDHLGKQGRLAEGYWRLRRLCLLTALAIMKHLVYQTPTEGGREQGSRGWEKEEWEKIRECHISTSTFSQRFITGRKLSGKTFLWFGQNKERVQPRDLTLIVLPRLGCMSSGSSLVIRLYVPILILALQCVSQYSTILYMMSKCRIQTTTLAAAEEATTNFCIGRKSHYPVLTHSCRASMFMWMNLKRLFRFFCIRTKT